MSLDIQKPAPLMVGDKAYYTLTSYDPISIEVEVPGVTEGDVDYALDTMLAQTGGTRADLHRASWLQAHTEGIGSEAELRAAIRAELEELNAEYVEQQKVGLAVAELTRRLKQAVPESVVQRIAEGLFVSFAQQLAAEGISPETFAARSGATSADIRATFEERALEIAEQEAALDAYARKKKIDVTEGEFAALLGIPEEQFPDVLKGVRASGSYGEMRDAALHAKAAIALMDECSCTYRHETPEEAALRVQQVRAMGEQLESIARQEEDDQSPEGDGDSGRPKLRLI